jgi:hypothetical protein
MYDVHVPRAEFTLEPQPACGHAIDFFVISLGLRARDAREQVRGETRAEMEDTRGERWRGFGAQTGFMVGDEGGVGVRGGSLGSS